MRPIIALILFVLCALAFAQSGRSRVSLEVRNTARKLAHQWVDTAEAATLDRLSERTIAFAGMVPNVFVVLDGHKMSATQALKESALTILTNHTTQEDADAIRNTVYALMEIADGRVTRH